MLMEAASQVVVHFGLSRGTVLNPFEPQSAALDQTLELSGNATVNCTQNAGKVPAMPGNVGGRVFTPSAACR